MVHSRYFPFCSYRIWMLSYAFAAKLLPKSYLFDFQNTSQVLPRSLCTMLWHWINTFPRPCFPPGLVHTLPASLLLSPPGSYSDLYNTPV